MSELNDLEEFEFDDDSFTLVQENVKISDQKMQTKTTTFLKDAFKRFCKNKSSVVGAIILGIIFLFTIFVPMISTKNISVVDTNQGFLAPKLFDSGTGFWDGTTKVSNIIYDEANDCPAGYLKNAVTNLVVDENETIQSRSSLYGKGGKVFLINETSSIPATDMNRDIYTKSLYHYESITFSKTGNVVAKIKLSNVEGINGYEQAEYRIILSSAENFSDSKDSDITVLKDWSKDYSELTINISEILASLGVSSVDGRFAFQIRSGNAKKSYLLIDSVSITSNDSSNSALSKISFVDGNSMLVRESPAVDKSKSDEYWQSNAIKSGYEISVRYCSFTYDTYEAAYGYYDVLVTKSELNTYIQNGWCSYDYKEGPSSFKKLSDECPIDNVLDQKLNSITGKLQEVTAQAYKYRTYGYSSMPKFLFGTDSYGYDLFRKVFTGLRTSFILGICTAAFCFAFGLVWGAISGYFGGNVDLAMERFCDILSGIPWIVMMTLFILKLGSNFFTFFLALCVTGWMGTAARTRTQFYRFKGREYVLASRTLGASNTRLIFRHILPNALGTIVTGAVLMIPSTIYSEATLAFLNLGLKNVEAFGVLLSDNQQYIATYPVLILFPSVIMALMMISFNLFGNGLRDALNPSLKGGE